MWVREIALDSDQVRVTRRHHSGHNSHTSTVWKLTALLEPLRKTPLYDFHIMHGAKMVPFAGYHMPLVYEDASQGSNPSLSRLEDSDAPIVASHQHVRQSAGLFDVGHMVQSKYAPQIDYLYPL